MQLDMFQDVFESEDIIIPTNLVPPHESTHSVKSKLFKELQNTFSFYCHEIKDYHNCTFFEARKMLLDCRDNNETIKVGKGFMERLNDI